MKLYILFAAFQMWLASVNSAGAAEVQKLSVQAEGHGWTYHLYVPDRVRASSVPLVVVFHGAGGDGRAYLEKDGWLAQSEHAGFAVAAPDGLPALPAQPASFRLNPRLWNSGQLKPTTLRGRIDDMAFVTAMLDDIVNRVHIDANRVFATGHSNGAGMTFMVGAKLSKRFAALATVMGQNSTTNPQPERALPTLVLLGTNDPLNPMEGGTRELPWGRSTIPPPMQGIDAWSQGLGCAAAAQLERDDDMVQVKRYGACRDGATVAVWLIKGQGHAWPGGQDSGLPESVLGPNSSRIHATREIWSFFSTSPIR